MVLGTDGYTLFSPGVEGNQDRAVEDESRMPPSPSDVSRNCWPGMREDIDSESNDNPLSTAISLL